MGRIVLFLRVSTSVQRLESQEDSLRRAALSDGYNEADFIVIGKKESAIKLSEEEREGLNELKSLIDKEEIDCIYIAELSRLSRRPHILYSIRELLLQKRIQMKCLNPQFTLLTDDRTKYDSSANLIFSLFGALAEQEMLEKKERFARGKKRKAEENKYNGGRVPYGYRVDKERDNLIIVDEHESGIVKLIYNLYEKGLSQPKIAKELNDSGKANIKISLINKILTNESYVGKKRKTKGASYDRAYPIIITQEQYDKCRKIANANNSTISKAKNIYYAEHLVRCSSCGAYWSATGCKASYHCAAAYKSASLWDYEYHKKERCTNKLSISINVLDSILWFVAIEKEACYMEQSTEETINTYITESNVINDKLRNIETRINEQEAKKERLREAYIDGLSKETYDRRKREIAETIRTIKEEEIRFKNELEHLKEIIVDLTNRPIYKPLSVSDIMNVIEGKAPSAFTKYPIEHSKLKRKIWAIDDDLERYKIIHRQIKNVEIKPIVIKYPFNSGEKDVKCKLIKVHTYIPSQTEKENNKQEGTIEFYYIPNGGNGPLIIDIYPSVIDDDTQYLYDYDFGDYVPFDVMTNLIYLNRFHDIPKKKKRNSKRDMIRQAIGDKLSISEIQKKYNLSYSAVYNKIHKGKVHSEMIGGLYYVIPDDAEKAFGKTQCPPSTID